MASPRPKPTNLKILEGNPGKRPLNLNEPKPAPIDLNKDCPDWLLEEAKLEWKRIAPGLKNLGLLTHIDVAVLAGYCQNYAKWKKAEEFLKEHGFTYKYPKKNKNGETIAIFIAPFPEVAIARQAFEQVRQCCIEFGLTPSSRCRMSLPNEGDKDDPLEKLLKENSLRNN